MSLYRKNIFIKAVIISVLFGVLVPVYFNTRASINPLGGKIDVFVYSFLFTSIVTFGLIYVVVPYIEFINKNIPWNKGILKRLIIELLSVNIITALTIAFLVYFVIRFFVEYTESIALMIFDHIIVSLFITNTATGIFEADYLIQSWKNSLVQNEKLAKQAAVAQYDALKNQVNPHFLFNSLNSLSSLIDTDTAKAKKFVLKFSEIYRYVLDVSNLTVIELYKEVEFINSYIFLHKIRFGDNLIVNVKFDQIEMQAFIIPLSLQLTIENSLKHNEISDDNHLILSLYTKDKFIYVENTLQIRELMEPSSGKGIKHLTERYKEVSDCLPEFYIENGKYIAKLPLISIDD